EATRLNYINLPAGTTIAKYVETSKGKKYYILELTYGKYAIDILDNTGNDIDEFNALEYELYELLDIYIKYKEGKIHDKKLIDDLEHGYGSEFLKQLYIINYAAVNPESNKKQDGDEKNENKQ
ncbi:MAG: hypothetical protein JHC30_00365, partial [Caldisericum sp.]|nr:hypothetical protein [Caldisericum sp.]